MLLMKTKNVHTVASSSSAEAYTQKITSLLRQFIIITIINDDAFTGHNTYATI